MKSSYEAELDDLSTTISLLSSDSLKTMYLSSGRSGSCVSVACNSRSPLSEPDTARALGRYQGMYNALLPSLRVLYVSTHPG